MSFDAGTDGVTAPQPGLLSSRPPQPPPESLSGTLEPSCLPAPGTAMASLPLGLKRPQCRRGAAVRAASGPNSALFVCCRR